MSQSERVEETGNPVDLDDRTVPIRERMVAYVHDLQERICCALEELDQRAHFTSDRWERPGGGGGLARVISHGKVFEKGGVNTSVVHGELPDSIAGGMNVSTGEFFATGISLVIHPESPRIPTIHANFRFFELKDRDSWFGGGVDLTPYVADEEDVRTFHETLRTACDRVAPESYRHFRDECDRYFYIPHRKESRGVGGLFYDYLRGDAEEMERWFRLQRSVGDAFIDSYAPIVRRHRDEEWTKREKEFQLLRRGRYVEFNLVYDRGTKFGLETDGRTESILMSLPMEARWEYCADMEQTESERILMDWLRNPGKWA